MDEGLIEAVAELMMDAEFNTDKFNTLMGTFITQIWLSGVRAGVENKTITIHAGPQAKAFKASELVRLMR